jgi:hypothetical protein
MILRLWDYFERSKPERQAYKKYLLTVVKRLGLPSDGNLEETIIQYVLDWVFRMMALACSHTTFLGLPYEIACNDRDSRSTKRQ